MSASPVSPKFEPVRGLVLPDLDFHPSPNVSPRLHGIAPYLAVVHRPASNGSYRSALSTLTNPSADVSSHILTGDGHKATQLVPWHVKSWSCKSFNSISYNFEIDDDAWDGSDIESFLTAAHIVAFVCHKSGIPPTWTRDPLNKPGVCRHLDLGVAGGGHTDPTENLTVWRNFLKQVEHDVEHTGWRQTWGKGTIKRIDV